jgi:hypothetical protein
VVKCPGYQLLTRSRFPQQKNSAGTGRYGGKDFEYPLHQGTPADQIADPKFSGEFLSKSLHLGQVAEGLRSSDHPSFGVVQQGRGNADGNAVPLGIDDVSGYADNRLTRYESLRQRTIHSAKAGTKDLRTTPPDRIGPFHAVISSAARLNEETSHCASTVKTPSEMLSRITSVGVSVLVLFFVRELTSMLSPESNRCSGPDKEDEERALRCQGYFMNTVCFIIREKRLMLHPMAGFVL